MGLTGSCEIVEGIDVDVSVDFDVVGVDAVGIAVSVGADVIGVRFDAFDGCVCEASICVDSVSDALTFECSVDALDDATTVSLFANVTEFAFVIVVGLFFMFIFVFILLVLPVCGRLIAKFVSVATEI
jgi:hypothetical protein